LATQLPQRRLSKNTGRQPASWLCRLHISLFVPLRVRLSVCLCWVVIRHLKRLVLLARSSHSLAVSDGLSLTHAVCRRRTYLYSTCSLIAKFTFTTATTLLNNAVLITVLMSSDQVSRDVVLNSRHSSSQFFRPRRGLISKVQQSFPDIIMWHLLTVTPMLVQAVASLLTLL